jgi:7,8-dihydro-6-hydroxymethylpterin dimethyltransferase
VLREDGKLIPTTHFDFTRKTVTPSGQDSAEQARQYVRRHWRYRQPHNPESDSHGQEQSAGLLERALSHFLCISGMAFQDPWNIDLERLRRCCVHVVTPQRKLVPFCAYYLRRRNVQSRDRKEADPLWFC